MSNVLQYTVGGVTHMVPSTRCNVAPTIGNIKTIRPITSRHIIVNDITHIECDANHAIAVSPDKKIWIGKRLHTSRSPHRAVL